jgi:hypothetical protein
MSFWVHMGNEGLRQGFGATLVFFTNKTFMAYIGTKAKKQFHNFQISGIIKLNTFFQVP